MLLGKGVLKICSKFKREHAFRSAILIKLLSNFIEITLGHGCSPVNLLHIFRHYFLRTLLEGCFWNCISSPTWSQLNILHKLCGHSKMMSHKDEGRVVSRNLTIRDNFLTEGGDILVSVMSWNLKNKTNVYWIGNFFGSLYKIWKNE